MSVKERILTGDRPTGKLHIGHFVGSLKNRVELQDKYDQVVLIADVQALTDNAENPDKIRKSIFEVALDYLAVGIDPSKTTIAVQSMIPQIAELTVLYLNLVSVGRLYRNPTVKNEIQQKSFGETIPAGFLAYPVSQAADITAFQANLVPVGSDQIPMIEQTCEIVDRFNNLYGETLTRPKAMVPTSGGRLPGINGTSKMSKSMNNAIYFADSEDEITKKVMGMYTDPNHLRIEDPGQIEGNTVFTYLDEFCTDTELVELLKAQYSQGGLGDVKVKRILNDVMQEFIRPIRKRRMQYFEDRQYVMGMLEEGTLNAIKVAEETLDDVKKSMGINYFS